MTVLLIHLSSAPSLRCEWVLIGSNGERSSGAGMLADLPRGADTVQALIPAHEVVVMRTVLPSAAARFGGDVLAYAVEERTLGDPETLAVSRLGPATGEQSLVAIVDKLVLRRWREALAGIGYVAAEFFSEIVALPRNPGEWSYAWNGEEGFYRSGDVEGGASDACHADAPPVALRLAVMDAATRAKPKAIAVYTVGEVLPPDVAAWQRELGVPVRYAGEWDWRTFMPQSPSLPSIDRRPGRFWTGMAGRLRPAAILLAIALVVHAAASTADWMSMVWQRKALSREMAERFRATFPEAVAVVAPELQMRRKLAEARHRAGIADEGDFLPLAGRAAAAVSGLPPGSVRALSYENARLTLRLADVDRASIDQAVQTLIRSGLGVDVAAASPGDAAVNRSGRPAITLTVRAP